MRSCHEDHNSPCISDRLSYVRPAAIQASPIQLNFGGTVNVVEDPFGLIGSLVAIRDPILASVRYDTTTTEFTLTIRHEARICRPGG